MTETKTYLPRWTKRAVLEGSGRDPLGLSRVSDNFTDLLLPSIITTTNRARYYSFYPWALRESLKCCGDYDGTTEFVDEFRKREAAFAIASKLGKETDFSIVGIDQVNKYLPSATDRFSHIMNSAHFPDSFLPVKCSSGERCVMGDSKRQQYPLT